MKSDLEKWVNRGIDSRGWTKKAVYEAIGVTQNGFNGMLRNKTISLKKFIDICNLVHIQPSEYFSKYENFSAYRGVASNILREPPMMEYKKETPEKVTLIETETDLINFQARQIERLTEAVRNLSALLGQGDTIPKES